MSGGADGGRPLSPVGWEQGWMLGAGGTVEGGAGAGGGTSPQPTTFDRQLNCWNRGRYFIGLFEQHIDSIRAAYALFADDESRRVFQRILQAYATVGGDAYAHLQMACNADCPCFHFVHEPDGYEVRGTANPYFLPEIFPFEQPVVLLDGGAYIGDSLQLAHEVLGPKLAYYYAFEPNEATFPRLQEAAAALPVAGRVYCQGLGERTGSFTFAEADARSMLVEDGASSVDVVAAGEFAAQADPRPTFVKLDVEGQEPAVLRSLAGFIAANKPDLAVSAYHELEHLWDIPLQIARLCPDYRIYLRHHSNFFTETICYAVA